MPLALSPIHPRARLAAPSGGTTLQTLAVLCACIFALYVAREVFIPIVLSILLAFVLAPIVRLFRRWRLPRIPAILLAVVLAVGVIASMATLIGMQLIDLGRNAPELQKTANEKIKELQTGPLGRLATFVHDANVAMRSGGRNAGGLTAEGAAPTAKKDPSDPSSKPLLVRLPEKEDTWITVAETVLGPIVSPLSTLGIVLVIVIFMLLEREDLRDRVIRLFGSGDFKATTDAIDDAARRLSVYFLAQVGVNATFGVVIGAGLAFIGVPSPVLWGVLAMLLRFVPYIGSLMSAALPIILAATITHGWGLAIKTAVLFAVAEGITGQVVEPLLYGRSTGLSAFAVVVAALFWAWLWGPIGLILSTPFTVALVVLGRHVRHLQFLDVMLGDQPALTPTENFYQRILAGDVDEARDHAERMLASRSLCAYHDDVTMSAMRLAMKDIDRGALAGEAVTRMKASLSELLGDLSLCDRAKAEADLPTLAGHSDAGAGKILCVAGRGALDDEATAMLAQLLRKHGVVAEIASHEAVSRRRMMELDGRNIAVVCLVHVEIGDHSPYLRYLVERIRQHLREPKIFLGLWSPLQDVPDETRLRRLGADRVAGSLRELLAACLEEVQVASTKVEAA